MMMVNLEFNQFIFDTVATHLHAQGKQSMNLDGKCCYRQKDTDGTTLSCAIGCLITDEDYAKIGEDFNSSSVRAILTQYQEPGMFQNFRDANIRLLRNLQMVHDTKSNWHNVDSMNQILNFFAMQYELTYVYRTSENSNIGKIAR